MDSKVLLRRINQKKKELDKIVRHNGQSQLTNGLVYKKSCELDKLIVQYMKLNHHQMELDFYPMN